MSFYFFKLSHALKPLGFIYEQQFQYEVNGYGDTIIKDVSEPDFERFGCVLRDFVFACFGTVIHDIDDVDKMV